MKYLNKISLILFIVFILSVKGIDCDSPHVKISENSKIIGSKEHTFGDGRKDRDFYAFRGIRYVHPTLGDLRWTEPKLLELTEPEYDARNFGSICPQQSIVDGSIVGNEDCLFLNVYTPKLPTESEKLLPVLFYIHGGGYSFGASNAIGPKFLMKHDVVLITFNYRLGVLGYLSTGSENLPGNYGALDQIAALDWVQKYIKFFNGDPNNITVFGHSAGAAATHLLTHSPRAKGKFHRAIIQSGASLSTWVVDEQPELFAKDYAKKLGCQGKISSPELAKCLKEKSTKELLETQRSFLHYWVLPVSLKHVVDNKSRGSQAFLPDSPTNLMDKGLYSSVPVITGIVAEEGLMPYTFLHLAVQNFEDNNTHFRDEIIPKIIRSILPYGSGEKHVHRVTKAVLNHYFPDEKSFELANKIRRVTEIFGDSMFNTGQREMLEKYAKHNINEVYSYIFTHRFPHSPTYIWKQIGMLRDLGIDHKLFDTAVTHVDDMFYHFYPSEQLPSDPNFKLNAHDVQFADYLNGIWAAFAETGNPNKGVNLAGDFPEWEKIQPGSLNYYNLSSISSKMGKEFQKEGSIFWSQIFKSLKSSDEKIEKDEL